MVDDSPTEFVRAHSGSLYRTAFMLTGDPPDRQRAAVVLHYFYDWPEVEIGAAIDCRPATVRSLAGRGLATLRASYGPLSVSAQTQGGAA